MPTFVQGESNMTVLPMEYSVRAVERDFVVLDEFVIGETRYKIIFDEKAPCVATIESAVSERKNKRWVHRIVGMLWLQKINQIGCVKLEKVWEDPDILQVEGVVVLRGEQRYGIATRMYETIVTKAGVTLLSDREQYAGGKNLWQKIAAESELLDVYLLDQDSASFFKYDGTRILYDGKNIPESEIWSIPPDTEMERIVLVAEPRKKENV